MSQILPMVPTSIPVDAVQYSRLKGLIPDCENPEKLIRLVCDVIESLSSVVHEQSNYIYLLENSELPKDR
ncbi:hypothetical protein D0962_34875 [Leptolyngbyaceae cyanobacterium CCMR0082]|uniref:Uncharacterized protein n=1 Tax=Adonisia turfae CCMR0082 TaxID=2304604 RepID=A0A6M0SH37_9CYAN|nr:hypothetical protein [Adonisia turfae CCMR0082]